MFKTAQQRETAYLTQHFEIIRAKAVPIIAVGLVFTLLAIIACGTSTPTRAPITTDRSVGITNPTHRTVDLLIINHPAELNFAIEDFPVGWQVGGKGEKDAGYEFTAVKLGILPTLPETMVASWVRVFTDVASASDGYMARRQRMAEIFRLEDPSVGDESFAYSGNVFEVFFRKNNVVARINMFAQYGGSRTEVKRWAEKLEAKMGRTQRLGEALPFAVASPTLQPAPTPTLVSVTTPSPAATRTTPTSIPTPTPVTIPYAFPTQVKGPVPTLFPTPPPTPTPQPSNVFIPTKNMSVGRVGHNAVLLPDGRVLVAGGISGFGACQRHSSADLFDPSTEVWTPAASMHTARSHHTMTLLHDGRVLVTGGQTDSEELTLAEIYDPRSNTWQISGSMSAHRAYHTATLLPNGQVLIVGGYAYVGPRVNPVWRRDSAEIFEPTIGTFFTTGKLNQDRVHHSATLLIDGRVLIVGGLGDSAQSSAEVFNPEIGVFSLTGGPVYGRRNTVSTLLPDGTVLVRGGVGDRTWDQSNRSAELYDPARGTFQLISQNPPPRYEHLATFLRNGKVLITGGTSSSEVLDSAELYNPKTKAFTLSARMNRPRKSHVAVELGNGTILIVGGTDSAYAGCNALSAAEIYYP